MPLGCPAQTQPQPIGPGGKIHKTLNLKDDIWGNAVVPIQQDTSAVLRKDLESLKIEMAALLGRVDALEEENKALKQANQALIHISEGVNRFLNEYRVQMSDDLGMLKARMDGMENRERAKLSASLSAFAVVSLPK